MKRTDLSAKTVAELKALAKKKKVSLAATSTKAAIIDALIKGSGSAKPAAKRAAVPKKAAIKTAKKAKTSSTRKVAAKAATKKSTKVTKAATTKRPAVKKRAPAKKAPAATPVREWKLPPNVEEPLMAHERIAESKYYTGPARPISAYAGELSQGYGEDRITLLSRDPYVAYAYWEATPARIEREKEWFGWDSKLCVRIYDVTGVQFDGRNAIGFYDQEVFERVGSWYFDFGRPTHSFCAELGLITPQGRFLTLVRSNYITMPRDGVSDVIDEEWMLVDEEFWKLYGYPEGFRQGVSSPEMQEMLRRRRMQEITSPGMFAADKVKRK